MRFPVPHLKKADRAWLGVGRGGVGTAATRGAGLLAPHPASHRAGCMADVGRAASKACPGVKWDGDLTR